MRFVRVTGGEEPVKAIDPASALALAGPNVAGVAASGVLPEEGALVDGRGPAGALRGIMRGVYLVSVDPLTCTVRRSLIGRDGVAGDKAVSTRHMPHTPGCKV
jgi:hypothetical protein